MNCYSIQVTDEINTRLASNTEGQILLFSSKSKAELLARKLKDICESVEVIPYLLKIIDTNYIFLDDSVDFTKIELVE
jgi:hypothetical protein